MKLEVGMYVRTNMGDISKIKSIWENERVFFENKVDIDYFTSDSFGISYLKECKASHNIIDLIEVGDYVNGHLIKAVYLDGVTKYIKLDNAYENGEGTRTYSEDIKSIVTKEMYSSVEYRVETD